MSELILKPEEDELFPVYPREIPRELFDPKEDWAEDRFCTRMRWIFELIDKGELSGDPFYTKRPKKTWKTMSTIFARDIFAPQNGGTILTWKEYNLHLAQRVANGYSMYDICRKNTPYLWVVTCAFDSEDTQLGLCGGGESLNEVEISEAGFYAHTNKHAGGIMTIWTTEENPELVPMLKIPMPT